jgi:hypothetical protein
MCIRLCFFVHKYKMKLLYYYKYISNRKVFDGIRFDSGYSTTATTIANKIAGYVNNQYLLGYFLDNEMWWGNDWRGQWSTLALYLNHTGTLLYSTLPSSLSLITIVGSAGAAKALSFLESKYSTIAALNSAWCIFFFFFF